MEAAAMTQPCSEERCDYVWVEEAGDLKCLIPKAEHPIAFGSPHAHEFVPHTCVDRELTGERAERVKARLKEDSPDAYELLAAPTPPDQELRERVEALHLCTCEEDGYGPYKRPSPQCPRHSIAEIDAIVQLIEEREATAVERAVAGLRLIDARGSASLDGWRTWYAPADDR